MTQYSCTEPCHWNSVQRCMFQIMFDNFAQLELRVQTKRHDTWPPVMAVPVAVMIDKIDALPHQFGQLTILFGEFCWFINKFKWNMNIVQDTEEVISRMIVNIVTDDVADVHFTYQVINAALVSQPPTLRLLLKQSVPQHYVHQSIEEASDRLLILLAIDHFWNKGPGGLPDFRSIRDCKPDDLQQHWWRSRCWEIREQQVKTGEWQVPNSQMGRLRIPSRYKLWHSWGCHDQEQSKRRQWQWFRGHQRGKKQSGKFWVQEEGRSALWWFLNWSRLWTLGIASPPYDIPWVPDLARK